MEPKKRKPGRPVEWPGGLLPFSVQIPAERFRWLRRQKRPSSEIIREALDKQFPLHKPPEIPDQQPQ